MALTDRSLNQQPTDLYYDRMGTATDDKAVLLEWLIPGSAADVGCADGSLTRRIAAHPDISLVYGYDLDGDALVRAIKQPIRAGSAPIRWRNGDTSWMELDTIALGKKQAFDNVVLCSVLHEIHSYAPVEQQRSFAAFHAAIDDAVGVLAPGGRLLVRDGVMPEQPDKLAHLVAPHAEGVDLVERYLDLVPFPHLREVTRLDENRWECSRHTAAEILLTVNWGEQSLPRESQEQYMLATLGGYTDLVVHDRPVELVHMQSYIQAGYLEHLVEGSDPWRLLDASTGSSWFPHTNAIWVFEKTR